MSKFSAKYIDGSDNSNFRLIGEYDTKEEAIDACCEYAIDDDDEFEEEEDMCREALELRGFYCVGYSTLALVVE